MPAFDRNALLQASSELVKENKVQIGMVPASRQMRSHLNVVSRALLLRKQGIHGIHLLNSAFRIQALSSSNRCRALSTGSTGLEQKDKDVAEEISDTQKVACEFFAQALFNFLSCSCVAQAVNVSAGNSVVQTGLVMGTHALIFPLVLYSAAATSGAHFNPMITSVFVALGKVPQKLGLAYVIAQLAGGIVGAAAAFSSLPGNAQNLAHAGVHAVPPTSSIAQAFMGEVYASFALIFVLCSVMLDPRSKWGRLAPLSIPITIILMMWLVGPISSACINPARAFGPALLTGFWEKHWIWWTAPFVGGLLAAKLYQFFLPKSVKL